MKAAEEEGRTYEEAVEKGLAKLAIGPQEAEIEILEEGSKGIFSVKPWRVRVSLVFGEGAVKRVVAGLLAKMEIEGSVDVEEREGIYFANISTSGMDGLLIGKSGKTLDALQHLVARMMNQMRPKTKVVVDVGGYKERQHEMLRKRAFGLAERVRETQKEIVMDPLRPSDRRIVHLALAEDPDVRTYTVGEGGERSVVIAPNVLRETPVGPELKGETGEGGDDSRDLNPSGGGGDRDRQDEWGERA